MALPHTTSNIQRPAIILLPIATSLIAYTLPSAASAHLAPFSPRAAIHSDSRGLTPILLAPISTTTSLPLLSRLAQCILFAAISPEVADIARMWAFTIVLALSRVATGYLLSRSVGWAYPALFSHSALYEAFGGFGPGLLVSLAMSGSGAQVGRMMRLDAEEAEYGLAVLTSVFCWLEGAPWTYAHALVGVAGVMLLQRLRSDVTQQTSSDVESRIGMIESKRQDRPAQLWGHPMSITLAFLAILVPSFLISTRPHVALPLAPAPSGKALLDILVLTHPRPSNLDPHTSLLLLNTTLSSFAPFLSDRISLSAFTHAPFHPAFDTLREAYASDSRVTFFRDDDTHEGEAEGHYLHLAEALRWAHERGRGREPGRAGAGADADAEWIMLVEDDFPLCRGAEGWGYVEEVLSRLEASRLGTGTSADGTGREGGQGVVRAGWVGTGGSGLIMHHTHLPLLSHLLHTYSRPIPLPNIARPNPDEVVQMCLLGRHTMCTRTDNADADANVYAPMVITSRQVLDHIGGMATTTAGKGLNSDKWRCGWRHAYHGADEVEVVVV